MRGFVVPVVVVGMALVGAGCGDDDDPVAVGDPSPAPTEPTATPAPMISSNVLTTEWGCGFGFWVSNPEQTVALLIDFSDFEAAAAGNVPPVGNVPSVVWSGEVRVGTDLMANWCDDVVEPDEPEPVVDERWTVVDGSVTVVGDVPVQDVGELTVELSGLVIESPTGERIDLDPLTIKNLAWGAFAG